MGALECMCWCDMGALVLECMCWCDMGMIREKERILNSFRGASNSVHMTAWWWGVGRGAGMGVNMVVGCGLGWVERA
jgi:hypothetical protein